MARRIDQPHIMPDVTIRQFLPHDLDWLVDAHGIYRETDGFDATFQPLVRSILEAFIADHDPQREHGWVAVRDEARLGSIFCVRLTDTCAKLRLFLLDPAVRGQGLGAELLQTCMTFARAAGYSDMTLWTHESHRAACALYARTGWRCIGSTPVHSFGQDLVEQTWTISLRAD